MDSELPAAILLKERLEKVTAILQINVSGSMKASTAILLAATVATGALAQNSTADLLRELQAQKALLEEQRQELKKMAESQESMFGAMDSAWLVLCGALVMFMHAGFAMLETGCCRAKNASNVLMKNLGCF